MLGWKRKVVQTEAGTLTWFECTKLYYSSSGNRHVKGPKQDRRRIKEGSKNSQKAAAEATHIVGSVANEL
jgi:hypothetical protein